MGSYIILLAQCVHGTVHEGMGELELGSILFWYRQLEGLRGVGSYREFEDLY